MEHTKREKLVKILGLTASPSDGEALSAARRAISLLKSEGETWESLIMGGRSSGGGSAKESPPQHRDFDWAKILRALIQSDKIYAEFKPNLEELLSLYQRGKKLTDTQMKAALDLYSIINRKS